MKIETNSKEPIGVSNNITTKPKFYKHSLALCAKLLIHPRAVYLALSGRHVLKCCNDQFPLVRCCLRWANCSDVS